MGAKGRSGSVVSDWSGGVGLVCGMKRGISEADLMRVLVQLGEGRQKYPTGALSPGVREAREWWPSVDRNGPVIGGSDVQLSQNDSTSPTSSGPHTDEPVSINCSCC